MKSRFNHKFRATALLIVLAFASQEIAHAAPANLPALFQPTLPMPKMAFKLPDSVAIIEDGWIAPPAAPAEKNISRTIILIQDAHTNDSAQMNLAHALHAILPAEGIKHIFTEAAQGDVSLTYLKPMFPRKALEEAARQFVRKGLIKGSEYLNVSSDDDFVIWGVEDKKLYDDAVLAYEAESDNRQKALSFIGRAQASLEELKIENTSNAYRKLDRLKTNYLDGKITLTSYLDGLKSSMRGDSTVSLRGAERRRTSRTPLESNLTENLLFGEPRIGLDALDKLDALRSRESKLNFDKISKEQEAALQTLSTEDRAELTADSAKSVSPFAFNPGSADKAPSGFYSLLEEKLTHGPSVIASAAKQSSKEPSREALYPNLFRYFAYLKSAKKLDASKVLKELDAFEATAFNQISKTREEKWFTILTRNLRAWRSMLELQMTPEEYSRYQSEKELFDLNVICGFVNGVIAKSKRHYDRALTTAGETDKAREAAERFYDLTFKRDTAFMEKLTAKMDADNIQKAVLITGGYHAANLKGLLRQKGYSYISIIPQVTHETDQARYERLLLKQVASITKERTALAKAQTAPDTSAHAAMTGYAAATEVAARLAETAARLANMPEVPAAARMAAKRTKNRNTEWHAQEDAARSLRIKRENARIRGARMASSISDELKTESQQHLVSIGFSEPQAQMLVNAVEEASLKRFVGSHTSGAFAGAIIRIKSVDRPSPIELMVAPAVILPIVFSSLWLIPAGVVVGVAAALVVSARSDRYEKIIFSSGRLGGRIKFSKHITLNELKILAPQIIRQFLDHFYPTINESHVGARMSQIASIDSDLVSIASDVVSMARIVGIAGITAFVTNFVWKLFPPTPRLNASPRQLLRQLGFRVVRVGSTAFAAIVGFVLGYTILKASEWGKSNQPKSASTRILTISEVNAARVRELLGVLQNENGRQSMAERLDAARQLGKLHEPKALEPLKQWLLELDGELLNADPNNFRKVRKLNDAWVAVTAVIEQIEANSTTPPQIPNGARMAGSDVLAEIRASLDAGEWWNAIKMIDKALKSGNSGISASDIQAWFDRMIEGQDPHFAYRLAGVALDRGVAGYAVEGITDIHGNVIRAFKEQGRYDGVILDEDHRRMRIFAVTAGNYVVSLEQLTPLQHLDRQQPALFLTLRFWGGTGFGSHTLMLQRSLFLDAFVEDTSATQDWIGEPGRELVTRLAGDVRDLALSPGADVMPEWRNIKKKAPRSRNEFKESSLGQVAGAMGHSAVDSLDRQVSALRPAIKRQLWASINRTLNSNYDVTDDRQIKGWPARFVNSSLPKLITAVEELAQEGIDVSTAWAYLTTPLEGDHTKNTDLLEAQITRIKTVLLALKAKNINLSDRLLRWHVIGRIYLYGLNMAERLPADWIESQMQRAAEIEPDSLNTSKGRHRLLHDFVKFPESSQGARMAGESVAHQTLDRSQIPTWIKDQLRADGWKDTLEVRGTLSADRNWMIVRYAVEEVGRKAIQTGLRNLDTGSNSGMDIFSYKIFKLEGTWKVVDVPHVQGEGRSIAAAEFTHPDRGDQLLSVVVRDGTRQKYIYVMNLASAESRVIERSGAVLNDGWFAEDAEFFEFRRPVSRIGELKFIHPQGLTERIPLRDRRVVALKDRHLNSIVSVVYDALTDGQEDPNVALRPIRSDMPALQIDKLQGQSALYVDAGGTNVRVGSATVDPGVAGSQAPKLRLAWKNKPVKWTKEDRASGKAFFARIAVTVEEGLKQRGLSGRTLFGGITFSFPNKDGVITKEADGVKGFRFDDVISERVLVLANAELKRIGSSFRFNAVGNDTLTALLLGKVEDPNTTVSIINGTGFNIGAVLPDPSAGDDGAINNLEAGGLAVSTIAGLPLTEVDRAFMRRGAEELIAGGFLGPLAAQMIGDRIEHGEMLKGVAARKPRAIRFLPPHRSKAENSFYKILFSDKLITTAALADFAQDDVEAADRAIDNQFAKHAPDAIPYLTSDDRTALRALSREILDRSADLVAAMTAGVLTAADKVQTGRVAVDGSRWEDARYLARFTTTLQSLLPAPKRSSNIVFRVADSSGVGAALLSIMVSASDGKTPPAPAAARMAVVNRNDLAGAIEFMSHSDTLPDKADVLMIPGHANLKAIEAAAGIATRVKTVVVSGGIGRLTPLLREAVRESEYVSAMKGNLDEMSEAEIIRDILKAHGVTTEILVEKEARNTTENFVKTKELLASLGQPAQTMIYMPDPLQVARTRGVFREVFYGDAARNPDYQPTDDQIRGFGYADLSQLMSDAEKLKGRKMLGLLNVLLSEWRKIKSYPAKGWMAPLRVGEDAINNFNRLASQKWMLFVHLLKKNRREGGLHTTTSGKGHAGFSERDIADFARVLTRPGNDFLAVVDLPDVLEALRGEDPTRPLGFFLNKDPLAEAIDAARRGADAVIATAGPLSDEVIKAIRRAEPSLAVFTEIALEENPADPATRKLKTREAIKAEIKAAKKAGATGVILKPWARGDQMILPLEDWKWLEKNISNFILMPAGGLFEGQATTFMRGLKRSVGAFGISAKTPPALEAQIADYLSRISPNLLGARMAISRKTAYDTLLALAAVAYERLMKDGLYPKVQLLMDLWFAMLGRNGITDDRVLSTVLAPGDFRGTGFSKTDLSALVKAANGSRMAQFTSRWDMWSGSWFKNHELKQKLTSTIESARDRLMGVGQMLSAQQRLQTQFYEVVEKVQIARNAIPRFGHEYDALVFSLAVAINAAEDLMSRPEVSKKFIEPEYLLLREAMTELLKLRYHADDVITFAIERNRAEEFLDLYVATRSADFLRQESSIRVFRAWPLAPHKKMGDWWMEVPIPVLREEIPSTILAQLDPAAIFGLGARMAEIRSVGFFPDGVYPNEIEIADDGLVVRLRSNQPEPNYEPNHDTDGRAQITYDVFVGDSKPPFGQITVQIHEQYVVGITRGDFGSEATTLPNDVVRLLREKFMYRPFTYSSNAEFSSRVPVLAKGRFEEIEPVIGAYVAEHYDRATPVATREEVTVGMPSGAVIGCGRYLELRQDFTGNRNAFEAYGISDSGQYALLELAPNHLRIRPAGARMAVESDRSELSDADRKALWKQKEWTDADLVKLVMTADAKKMLIPRLGEAEKSSFDPGFVEYSNGFSSARLLVAIRLLPLPGGRHEVLFFRQDDQESDEPKLQAVSVFDRIREADLSKIAGLQPYLKDDLRALENDADLNSIDAAQKSAAFQKSADVVRAFYGHFVKRDLASVGILDIRTIEDEPTIIQTPTPSLRTGQAFDRGPVNNWTLSKLIGLMQNHPVEWRELISFLKALKRQPEYQDITAIYIHPNIEDFHFLGAEFKRDGTFTMNTMAPAFRIGVHPSANGGRTLDFQDLGDGAAEVKLTALPGYVWLPAQPTTQSKPAKPNPLNLWDQIDIFEDAMNVLRADAAFTTALKQAVGSQDAGVSSLAGVEAEFFKKLVVLSDDHERVLGAGLAPTNNYKDSPALMPLVTKAAAVFELSGLGWNQDSWDFAIQYFKDKHDAAIAIAGDASSSRVLHSKKNAEKLHTESLGRRHLSWTSDRELSAEEVRQDRDDLAIDFMHMVIPMVMQISEAEYRLAANVILRKGVSGAIDELIKLARGSNPSTVDESFEIIALELLIAASGFNPLHKGDLKQLQNRVRRIENEPEFIKLIKAEREEQVRQIEEKNKIIEALTAQKKAGVDQMSPYLFERSRLEFHETNLQHLDGYLQILTAHRANAGARMAVQYPGSLAHLLAPPPLANPGASPGSRERRYFKKSVDGHVELTDPTIASLTTYFGHSKIHGLFSPTAVAPLRAVADAIAEKDTLANAQARLRAAMPARTTPNQVNALLTAFGVALHSIRSDSADLVWQIYSFLMDPVNEETAFAEFLAAQLGFAPDQSAQIIENARDVYQRVTEQTVGARMAEAEARQRKMVGVIEVTEGTGEEGDYIQFLAKLPVVPDFLSGQSRGKEPFRIYVKGLKSPVLVGHLNNYAAALSRPYTDVMAVVADTGRPTVKFSFTNGTSRLVEVTDTASLFEILTSRANAAARMAQASGSDKAVPGLIRRIMGGNKHARSRAGNALKAFTGEQILTHAIAALKRSSPEETRRLVRLLASSSRVPRKALRREALNPNIKVRVGMLLALKRVGDTLEDSQTVIESVSHGNQAVVDAALAAQKAIFNRLKDKALQPDNAGARMAGEDSAEIAGLEARVAATHGAVLRARESGDPEATQRAEEAWDRASGAAAAAREDQRQRDYNQAQGLPENFNRPSQGSRMADRIADVEAPFVMTSGAHDMYMTAEEERWFLELAWAVELPVLTAENPNPSKRFAMLFPRENGTERLLSVRLRLDAAGQRYAAQVLRTGAVLDEVTLRVIEPTSDRSAISGNVEAFEERSGRVKAFLATVAEQPALAGVPMDVLRDLTAVSEALKDNDEAFTEYAKDVISSFLMIRAHLTDAVLYLPTGGLKDTHANTLFDLIEKYGMGGSNPSVILAPTDQTESFNRGRLLISVYADETEIPTRSGKKPSGWNRGHLNFRHAMPSNESIPSDSLISVVTSALDFVAGKAGALKLLQDKNPKGMILCVTKDRHKAGPDIENPLSDDRYRRIVARIKHNSGMSAAALEMRVLGRDGQYFSKNETLLTLAFRIGQILQLLRTQRAAVESAA